MNNSVFFSLCALVAASHGSELCVLQYVSALLSLLQPNTSLSQIKKTKKQISVSIIAVTLVTTGIGVGGVGDKSLIHTDTGLPYFYLKNYIPL